MRFYIIFLIFLSSVSLLAQTSTLTSKESLPWVHGKLPSNAKFVNYKVVMGEGEQLKNAQDDAVRILLFELGAEKGVQISSETIVNTQEHFSSGNGDFATSFSDEIKVSQKGFNISFYRVGEYHEFKRINGQNRYLCWQLYAIGNNLPPQITNIDYTSSYGWDAAWRSALIAGWGQLYKKDNAKGILLMSLEALSIGSIIYTQNKYNYNLNRIQESPSMDVRKEYQSRADDYYMYRNIAIGAGIATIVWSVIDAVATDGAPKYLSDSSPFRLDFNVQDALQINLCYNF